jgi:hypothetical protein
MVRSLPPHPSLEQLRRLAKDLLKAHRRGEPECCQVVRRLKQFQDKTDAEILVGHVSLVEVQYALALEYGFESWEQLRAHIVSLAFVDAASALDLRKAQLTGKHEDSFSVTMQAVGRFLGKELDYETVYSLSTNGFAPDIRPDEDCKSTWRMLGRGKCIDLVAAFMGLRATPVTYVSPPRPPPDASGRFWGTPAAAKWLREEMRACAAAVRAELDAEAVVVTSGGWKDHWEMWGVVLEAGEDGRILGRAQLGPPENVLDHGESFWALRPAPECLTQDQSDRQMLDQALHRIRGDREPFRPGKLVFGLPAMDLWIAQMLKPAFQEDSPHDSAGNASLCARYTCDGARIVASYLLKRAASFPAPARPHVQRVLGRYGRIAGLLEPFSDKAKGRGYDDIMGNAVRQEQHAREILMPVRLELVGAAGDIEAALHAMET